MCLNTTLAIWLMGTLYLIHLSKTFEIFCLLLLLTFYLVVLSLPLTFGVNLLLSQIFLNYLAPFPFTPQTNVAHQNPLQCALKTSLIGSASQSVNQYFFQQNEFAWDPWLQKSYGYIMDMKGTCQLCEVTELFKDETLLKYMKKVAAYICTA